MNTRPRDTRRGSNPLLLALALAAASCAGGSSSSGTGGSGQGGTTATGGSTGTGGVTGTGGTSSTGGTTGTGGTIVGTGGTNNAGGTTGTGGSNATGGTTGTGGTTSTGGTIGTGGAGGAKATGGTTGTGGTSATGGTSGSGGGSTGFCPSGAIFCADFEEASGVPTNHPVGTAMFEDPSEYGWMFGGTSMSAMGLDTGDMPYDGKQSLKINATSNFAIRTLAVTVPTTFWVRLYIKSDQAIGQPDHNSFFAAGLTADYSTAKNVEVSEQFGCVLLNASDTLFPTGTTCGANTALSANTWHCMVAEFDGTNGNVQVFSGSTQIINAQAWTPAKEAFTTFSFGYYRYNSEPGTGGSGTTLPDPNVWYDDVVVSANSLSCP